MNRATTLCNLCSNKVAPRWAGWREGGLGGWGEFWPFGRGRSWLSSLSFWVAAPLRLVLGVFVASALRPARDFADRAQKTGYIKKSAEDVF